MLIKNSAEFPYPTLKSVNLRNIEIVVLDVPPKAMFNENVFGVDSTGRVIWQIQTVPHVRADSPYTNIEIDEASIVAYNFDGQALRLDAATGGVIAKEFHK